VSPPPPAPLTHTSGCFLLRSQVILPRRPFSPHTAWIPLAALPQRSSQLFPWVTLGSHPGMTLSSSGGTWSRTWLLLTAQCSSCAPLARDISKSRVAAGCLPQILGNFWKDTVILNLRKQQKTVRPEERLHEVRRGPRTLLEDTLLARRELFGAQCFCFSQVRRCYAAPPVTYYCPQMFGTPSGNTLCVLRCHTSVTQIFSDITVEVTFF